MANSMSSDAKNWVPNEEGKDLPQPLPFKSKNEIDNVKVYQMEGSPPCCAIRAFLTFGGIPFEVVNIDPMSKSELAFSTYKKVPIIVVNGLQINDSAIIIKTLAPICFGRAPTEIETAQIHETTSKGMLAFEIELFGSDKNIELYANKFLSAGCMGWLLKMIAPFIMKSIPGKIKEKHPQLEPFTSYGKAFKSKLTSTFIGGSSPGPADVQLWGLVNLAKECKLVFIDDWLSECGLGAWYAALAAQMPASIFSA